MMTSYLDLLAVRYEAVFDERARGYMTQVTTSAQRLREMIQGILAYLYSSGITGNGSGLARGIFGVYALTSRCLDSRPGLGVDHACPISCIR
jgi:hypothetical protein